MNIKRAEKQLKKLRTKIENKEADLFIEFIRVYLMKQGADRYARRIEEVKYNKANQKK